MEDNYSYEIGNSNAPVTLLDIIHGAETVVHSYIIEFPDSLRILALILRRKMLH